MFICQSNMVPKLLLIYPNIPSENKKKKENRIFTHVYFHISYFSIWKDMNFYVLSSSRCIIVNYACIPFLLWYELTIYNMIMSSCEFCIHRYTHSHTHRVNFNFTIQACSIRAEGGGVRKFFSETYRKLSYHGVATPSHFLGSMKKIEVKN